MKHLCRIIGLCLAAVFTMSMALTAAASAATPVWEQCREAAGTGTKWEDVLCEKASSTGKWEWRELTTTEKAKSMGTITFKDVKTLLGTAEVTCSETGEGTLGPGKYAKITAMTFEKCKTDNNKVCEEGAVTAKAVHLPWQTELVGTESAVREDGGGTPGWSVTCSVLKAEKTTECTTNAAGWTIFGLSWNRYWYLLTWLPSTAKSKCNEGGEGAGEVEAYIQLASSADWGLRIRK